MTWQGSPLLTHQLSNFPHKSPFPRSPEAPLHAFRIFTARTLHPSRATRLNSANHRTPALPLIATTPRRVRHAQSGAADFPQQLRVLASTAPRTSLPFTSRAGPPLTVASGLRGATAWTLTWVPVAPQTDTGSHPPPPPVLGEAQLGGYAARRPAPIPGTPSPPGSRIRPRRPGGRGEAGTHLFPARSVFSPVSSAASPAPPHPPQQEVTSSAAFVTSILSRKGGGGGGALPPVPSLTSPHPAASPFPFSFQQTPTSARTPPPARSSRHASRASAPARPVRHAAGARYARSWRAAGPVRCWARVLQTLRGDAAREGAGLVHASPASSAQWGRTEFAGRGAAPGSHFPRGGDLADPTGRPRRRETVSPTQQRGGQSFSRKGPCDLPEGGSLTMGRQDPQTSDAFPYPLRKGPFIYVWKKPQSFLWSTSLWHFLPGKSWEHDRFPASSHPTAFSLNSSQSKQLASPLPKSLKLVSLFSFTFCSCSGNYKYLSKACFFFLSRLIKDKESQAVQLYLQSHPRKSEWCPGIVSLQRQKKGRSEDQ